jgi:predicted molibdopterin-dependent oxidoreductase YjgC
MFRPIDPTSEKRAVTLQVEGKSIVAREGDTLAMALLNAGVTPFRLTPVSEKPRAPLCLMGVCFDCLVEVDSQQNVQSCMVEVKDGMHVLLQHGARHMEGLA